MLSAAIAALRSTAPERPVVGPPMRQRRMQPVALLSLITTLFPHLPHRQVHVFRQVLIVGVGCVLLLAALRLVAPATLVSVLLLPVLYLLYLYEFGRV